ncbi:MAG TPA: hypothetical protein VK730_11315 [Solirubrobacteraceae bacterium]|nr:hypothetical protein [Solirubrobacteraceae bacterium]
MSDRTGEKSAAARATDERFLKAVMGEDRRYPSGSEFVASSVEGLGQIVSRNLGERRPTVIVHDDGSDVVIEPTNARLAAGFVILLLGVFLQKRAKPTVEAGGEIIELPMTTRLQLHPPSTVAA